MAEMFGVIITAKMRHAALWAAAKAAGGQSALARQLGIGARKFNQWVNLQTAPSHMWLESDLGQDVAAKLSLACDQTPEDLWPEPLRAAIKGGELGKRIERRHDLTMAELAYRAQERLTLPSPDDVAANADRKLVLQKLIRKLRPRLRDIVECRFGLNGQRQQSLEEVAKRWGVTQERVRQLESRAMRKLEDYATELPADLKEELASEQCG